MTLDVPNEYEEILRRAVASGAFASEQEALVRALELLAQQTSQLPRLPDVIDIDELAADQNVGVFHADTPVASIWPEDESADDFLFFLKQTRSENVSGRAP
ncbi:MAG: hypothetical protein KDB27_16190 [Planctomycetales bacterium]|nr:hypothetical protein [Planctomycetales bacterium]